MTNPASKRQDCQVILVHNPGLPVIESVGGEPPAKPSAVGILFIYFFIPGFLK